MSELPFLPDGPLDGIRHEWRRSDGNVFCTLVINGEGCPEEGKIPHGAPVFVMNGDEGFVWCAGCLKKMGVYPPDQVPN